MPPVLAPVSPSPTRLKSWAGTSGDGARPVAEHEQRALLAVEPLLDDDRRARVAEGVAAQLVAHVGAAPRRGRR